MLNLNTVGWLYCLNMNGALAVFVYLFCYITYEQIILEENKCNPAAQMLKKLSTVLLISLYRLQRFYNIQKTVLYNIFLTLFIYFNKLNARNVLLKSCIHTLTCRN